jgi:hypothetical protein
MAGGLKEIVVLTRTTEAKGWGFVTLSYKVLGAVVALGLCLRLGSQVAVASSGKRSRKSTIGLSR